MDNAALIKLLQEQGVKVPANIQQEVFKTMSNREIYERVISFVESLLEDRSFESLQDEPCNELFYLINKVMSLLFVQESFSSLVDQSVGQIGNEELTLILGGLENLSNAQLLKLINFFYKTEQFKKKRTRTRTRRGTTPVTEVSIDREDDTDTPPF
jgi:hypothetical protein